MRKHLSLYLLLLSLIACSSQPPSSGTATSSVPTETLEAIQARANSGDKIAQFTLGALYEQGEGVPHDLAQARSWFEKAAKQGEPRAQFNLGVMYYLGEGVQKDFAVAREWFTKAAAQNNPRAQFNLGVIYYRGEGTAQNLSLAHELFIKSATQGLKEAQFNLGVMYAKGENVKTDPLEAYAWFSIAKEYGDPKAEDLIKQGEAKMTPAQLQQAKKRADDLRKTVKKTPEV